MGGMGLTGAEDIRGAAWVGTWALVTRPIRELHRPFADLDVSTAPGECFAQFSPTNEYLHQAQRRYTSGVHHSNWLALAEELTKEALRSGGRKAPSKRKKVGGRKNHKCWREAIRFVAFGANVDFPKYFEKYDSLDRKEKFPEIYHIPVLTRMTLTPE